MNAVSKIAGKMLIELQKQSADIYEDPKFQPRFGPGDLVSYMRQEATYITSMPGGKALVNMSGTNKTDFKEVDENNLRMIEPRHMRKTHRHTLKQPAMVEPMAREPAQRFDAALLPSSTRQLSDLELYRLETRAMRR